MWVVLDTDGRLCAVSRENQQKNDLDARPAPQAAGSSLARTHVSRDGTTPPVPSFVPPPRFLVAANTRQDVYLFTASGRAARIQGHQWPEPPGLAAADFADLRDSAGGSPGTIPPGKERIVSLVPVLPTQGDEPDPVAGFLVLGTALGKVKRVALADLLAQAHSSPQVIGLEPGDELVWAAPGRGGGDVLLITAVGQAIRFAEDEVRAMGLPAGGIGGIRLREGDRVVAGMVLVAPAAQQPDSPTPSQSGQRKPRAPRHSGARPGAKDDAAYLAIFEQGGQGKRVPLAELPTQGRNGTGVITARTAGRSGAVIGAALLGRGAWLTCVTANGKTKTLAARLIPEVSRTAPGKPIIALARVDCLARVLVFAAEELSGNGGGAPGSPGEEPDGDSDGAVRRHLARTAAKRDRQDGNGIAPPAPSRQGDGHAISPGPPGNGAEGAVTPTTGAGATYGGNVASSTTSTPARAGHRSRKGTTVSAETVSKEIDETRKPAKGRAKRASTRLGAAGSSAESANHMQHQLPLDLAPEPPPAPQDDAEEPPD